MAKRGETLELAVLGLLHENPLHGYELRKQLTVVLGWGRVLSYGSLYPALKKMLRAGWLREYVVPPEPGAPTAAGGRQPSTAHHLRAHRRGLRPVRRDHRRLRPVAWEDDVFGVRFAFFGRTDRETRLRILEGRRTRLEERLERVKKQIDHLTGNDTYTAELQRHGLESVEREVLLALGPHRPPSATTGRPRPTRPDPP